MSNLPLSIFALLDKLASVGPKFSLSLWGLDIEHYNIGLGACGVYAIKMTRADSDYESCAVVIGFVVGVTYGAINPGWTTSSQIATHILSKEPCRR